MREHFPPDSRAFPGRISDHILASYHPHFGRYCAAVCEYPAGAVGAAERDGHVRSRVDAWLAPGELPGVAGPGPALIGQLAYAGERAGHSGYPPGVAQDDRLGAEQLGALIETLDPDGHRPDALRHRG